MDGNLFIISLFVVSACHGGFTAILSPVCADNFGLKNHAVNYTLLFITCGFSGVIGPQLGALIREAKGDYGYAFLIVAGFCIVGFILVLFLHGKKRATERR